MSQSSWKRVHPLPRVSAVVPGPCLLEHARGCCLQGSNGSLYIRSAFPSKAPGKPGLKPRTQSQTPPHCRWPVYLANFTASSFYTDYDEARELKSSTPELVSNDISVKDSWQNDLLGKKKKKTTESLLGIV